MGRWLGSGSGGVVGGLDQGLEGWVGSGSEGMGVVMSPDSLCRWQVQVSVYCA